MKSSFILLVIFTCTILSCDAALHANSIIHLTDSNYAIIPYTIADSGLFEKAKPATLTHLEIQEIETLTNKSIVKHNIKTTKWETIGKIDYKVQLVPVINEKGEKEVWINCFCSDFGHDWRKDIMYVDDGGSCFFNLKINLSTKKYYDLSVNANI